MAEVPIPLTDQEVDTSDGLSAGMTVGLLIAGFALFAWARQVGDYLATEANSFITELVGIDPTSGESGDQGPPGV